MLKTLFHYYKKLFVKKQSNTEYGLTLKLLFDNDIDIQLQYPILDNYDINHIPEVAEKYAQLLLYINSATLRYKLVDTLLDKGKRNDNIKEKLFFDNVIAFHDTIRQQILQDRHNKGPLIRPISVFSAKQL